VGRKKKGERYYKESEFESDKELRKWAFEELCAHIESGLSPQGFELLSVNTVNAWFERFPEEFRRDRYEISLRKGFNWWESVGKRQTLGTCNGNSRTWYYNMSNKYGWSDRQHVESNAKVTTQVQIVNYGDGNVVKDST
jgi:hypothetical protein